MSTSSIYASRIEATSRSLQEHDVDGILLGIGPDLRWMTGYAPYLLERVTLFVLPLQGAPTLLVPLLERVGAEQAAAVRDGLVALRTWEETDDPYAIVHALLPSLSAGRLFVSDHLWAVFLLRLQETFPQSAFGMASELLKPHRMAKDLAEQTLLREASAAADRVVEQLATMPMVGRTERSVSREIKDRLADAGLDADVYAIVASGPNSAAPHHSASERVIQPGEPVMFDIGGSKSGYNADTTRMLWVTGGDVTRGPDEEFRRLYSVLEAGQAAARDLVRPGVSCEAIDAAARSVIADGGYGANFVHRTGHGIGLDIHEDPYIVAGNADLLEDGHAFSIEPGIYLDGQYGARIEDIVICTPEGADPLNRVRRDLRVVSGKAD